MKKIIIKATEKPKKPLYGDYPVLYGLGVDDERTIYELYFNDGGGGKIGKLESVKNCIDGRNIPVDCVVIRGLEKWQKKRK